MIFYKDVIGTQPNYNINPQQVTFSATNLQVTVNTLLGVINGVEVGTGVQPPVFYDAVANLLRFATNPPADIAVPEIDERAMVARFGLDMEMVANFLNLYIDHAYYFRHPTNPGQFAVDKAVPVGKIIAAIRMVMLELSQATATPPSRTDDDANTLYDMIATRITEKYGIPCQQLFLSRPALQNGDNTTVCARGLRERFDRLGLRSNVFLLVLVHYILSRILIVQNDPVANATQTNTDIDTKFTTVIMRGTIGAGGLGGTPTLGATAGQGGQPPGPGGPNGTLAGQPGQTPDPQGPPEEAAGGQGATGDPAGGQGPPGEPAPPEPAGGQGPPGEPAPPAEEQVR